MDNDILLIDESKNLNELCNNLNNFYNKFDDDYSSPSDYIDLSDLPRFADVDVVFEEEVYSLDENSVMIYSPDGSEEFFKLMSINNWNA